MLLSLVYLFVRGLLRLLIPGDEVVRSAEVELLVLRHEVKVLRRQVRRPAYLRRDRVLLARVQPASAPDLVASLPRDPADASALAPGSRSTEMDLPPARGSGSASDRR